MTLVRAGADICEKSTRGPNVTPTATTYHATNTSQEPTAVTYLVFLGVIEGYKGTGSGQTGVLDGVTWCTRSCERNRVAAV